MNSIKIKKSKLNKQNSSKDIERLKKEEQTKKEEQIESDREEQTKKEEQIESDQEEELEQEQEQEDITNIKILKKRGRKPKLKTQDELETIEILKQKK